MHINVINLIIKKIQGGNFMYVVNKGALFGNFIRGSRLLFALCV